MGNHQGPTVLSTGNSAQCFVPVWMGAEFRRQWIHVYVWPSPFSVHLKLSQRCYSTVCVSCSFMSNSLRPQELQPTKFLCPWNSPDKNTGVGSHSLLQGIFLTQRLNLGLLHCRQIFFYCLNHQGSTAPPPQCKIKSLKFGGKNQNSVCTFQRVHHWGIQMHPYCWLWVT